MRLRVEGNRGTCYCTEFPYMTHRAGGRLSSQPFPLGNALFVFSFSRAERPTTRVGARSSLLSPLAPAQALVAKRWLPAQTHCVQRVFFLLPLEKPGHKENAEPRHTVHLHGENVVHAPNKQPRLPCIGLIRQIPAGARNVQGGT